MEVISHTLPEEKLQEIFGSVGWKQLPDEVYKRVRVQPAVYTVEEHQVAVYAGKDNQTIVKADRPKELLRNSILTPSLAASIMNAKYVNGMPLARQEREFARYNLNLSTKTMANWIIGCANRYLKPLYDRMKEEFLKSRYIHCDETRIQVIGEPDQKGTTQNWMWVYLTDEYSESPRMALFDYERTRAGYHPVKFLDGRFHGYLTCDGYQAYHGLDDSITVTGCFTHARRRFDAALTALKKDFTREQLKQVRLEDALKHPNWSMGRKITIDSSTMVNKGLEVMEARWLFDVDLDRIQVVVQPKSIIHSMVQFEDGAVMAQLGTPDMKLPIQYALYYPERRPLAGDRLDFWKLTEIAFEKPDPENFRGLALAYEAGKAGGSLPVVFNAANEFAVAEFLDRRAGYLEITDMIAESMAHHTRISHPSLDQVLEAEQETYEFLRRRQEKNKFQI